MKIFKKFFRFMRQKEHGYRINWKKSDFENFGADGSYYY